MPKFVIMRDPKECQNIQEIRNAIDEIDYQILAFFGKRHKYVKEIVKFKSDKDGIVAKDRQIEVLKKRREWANAFGLDPELFEDIYKTLISWNIQKEMEILNSNEKSNIKS